VTGAVSDRSPVSYRCPLCGKELQPVDRYPRYVCPDCGAKACSRDDRPLAFFNLGLSGGYGARYADDGSPYDSHDCFIDGHPCRADEARFGGIVIEAMQTGPDWPGMDDRQLLSAYGALMDELKRRGIVRSSNNPVADYAEALVCQALGLSREVPSRAGFDALGRDGRRYQIKGRRLTEQDSSTQLGAIRNLGQRPFDLLAAVAFGTDLSVRYAALIPIELVAEKGRFSCHTNAHVFHFRRGLLEDARVTDITAALATAR
jgi:predicted RNA-binding Zn-ribbon protein involved in translation (DUF1610 family)